MAKALHWFFLFGGIAAVVGAVASTRTLSVTASQVGLGTAELSKVIALDPNNALAYYNLGVALGKQGKWAEAIVAEQKAIRLKPNFAEAYYNLGTALGGQGKTAEAIVAFQKAIRLNPNNAGAYYNLGTALGKQGKTAGAIAAYKKGRDLYRSQGKTQLVGQITQALKQLGSR
jgi:tetratricopeptide (TPR) repeat protein